MSENTSTSSVPNILEELNKPKEVIVTKESLRTDVWQFMSQNKLCLFPGAYGRIPNFKGADVAVQKLNDLDVFKKSKSIEVSPDKALEAARMITLQNNKDLYVPIPKIRDGIFKKLELDGSTDIRKIVSIMGIENAEKKVDINNVIHVDLLVVGSVAVSRDGYRIGKGRGLGDLEFALLREMKALDENTIIVTIVHDCQIYDELPKHLFRNYDVPVDYIITPTTVLKVENKLPRPEGIYWSFLTQKRIDKIPILKKLKKKYESEGVDTTLATAEEDPTPRRYYGYRRTFKRREKLKTSKEQVEKVTLEKQSDSKKENMVKSNKPGDRSKSVKPRQLKKNKENISAKETSDRRNPNDNLKENNENIPPQLRRKKKFRKSNIDYSLHVSNIRKEVKVRDLKNALLEKGIKPNSITWRGFHGFCFLHYAKNNKNKLEEEGKEEPVAIDNIIELIQQLKVNPDNENLNVKVLEPITKIETVNITAV